MGRSLYPILGIGWELFDLRGDGILDRSEGFGEGEKDVAKVIESGDGGETSADRGGAGFAFDVEGELGAHLAHGAEFDIFEIGQGPGFFKGFCSGFFADHKGGVFEGGFDAVVDGGEGRDRFSGESGADAGEGPRVGDGGAPDHDAVTSGFVDHADGVFRGFDVAVTDQGDLENIAEVADEVPVGLAFEALFGEPGVEGEHLGASVLEPFGEVGSGEKGVVPSGADFDGDGDFHRFDAGGDDLGGEVGVFQEGGSGAGAADFGHPAAHVNVEEVGTEFFGHAGAFGHFLDVSAEDLDAEGAFFGVDPHFFEGAVGGIVDGHGADELGEHESGAGDALGENAERQVADVLHGREKEGVFDLDLADFESRVGGRRHGVGRGCILAGWGREGWTLVGFSVRVCPWEMGLV